MNILQKEDLAAAGFANSGTNAAGGIAVRTDAGSTVGAAITAATPDASTTVKGLVELATVAETDSFDAVRAVTPAGFKTTLALPSGASLSGWQNTGVGAVLRTLESRERDSVHVKDYGAVGDGVANDTASAQAALNHAAATNKKVIFTPGVYRVSTLLAPAGIAGIECEGTIKGLGTAPIATLVLGSDTAPVTKATFVLKMDQSGGDLRAVQGNSTSDCHFVEGHIYGFVDSATLNHYAFGMYGRCDRNTFAHNNIDMFNEPVSRGFGIAFYGEQGVALPYAGFFDGIISRSDIPSVGNTITGNVITNGSYAVSLQYADYNTVTGNYCKNQNHRSIYLANGAWGNTIAGNVLLEYTSTAVLFGYCASNNTVVGNHCETTAINGEAAINMTTGARFNLVDGNRIKGPTNYGVYLACDAVANVVSNNHIDGQYQAGVYIENDWLFPRPANAIFSRTNYGAPPAPYTKWSSINSEGNVIKGNVIGAGHTGRNTAAFGAAQINAGGLTAIADNTFSDNHVISGTNIGWNLHFYADDAAKHTGSIVTNNMFHPGNTELNSSPTGATAWAPRIGYFEGNKQFDKTLNAEQIVFTDLDTTPSVLTNTGQPGSRTYSLALYTAPTVITNFDDGFNGQTITVRLGANVTIAYNSALIRTKGLVNIVGGSGNNFVQFIRVGGIWFETFRSF